MPGGVGGVPSAMMGPYPDCWTSPGRSGPTVPVGHCKYIRMDQPRELRWAGPMGALKPAGWRVRRIGGRRLANAADVQASRCRGPVFGPLAGEAKVCSAHRGERRCGGLVGQQVQLNYGFGGVGARVHRCAVARQRRHAPSQHDHRLAAGAAPGRAGRWGSHGGQRRGAQVQQLQQSDGAGAVGVQEAEVARSAQALGQHMLQQQPEEVFAGQVRRAILSVLESRYWNVTRPSASQRRMSDSAITPRYR